MTDWRDGIVILFCRSTRPDWLGLRLLAALSVFGWAFFLFALQAACRRWDMGQQPPATSG